MLYGDDMLSILGSLSGQLRFVQGLGLRLVFESASRVVVFNPFDNKAVEVSHTDVKKFRLPTPDQFKAVLNSLDEGRTDDEAIDERALGRKLLEQVPNFVEHARRQILSTVDWNPGRPGLQQQLGDSPRPSLTPAASESVEVPNTASETLP